MKKTIIIFGTILIFLCASTITAGETKGIFGVKFGTYGAGTVTLTDKVNNAEVDFRTLSNNTFGILLDYPIKSNWLAGLSVDIVSIETKALDTVLHNKSLLNLSLNMKRVINTSGGNFKFQPSIGLGVAMVPKIDEIKASQYTTMRIFVEMLIKPSRLGFLVDVGQTWSLGGGNGDYSIKMGAVTVMRVGIVF